MFIKSTCLNQETTEESWQDKLLKSLLRVQWSTPWLTISMAENLTSPPQMPWNSSDLRLGFFCWREHEGTVGNVVWCCMHFVSINGLTDSRENLNRKPSIFPWTILKYWIFLYFFVLRPINWFNPEDPIGYKLSFPTCRNHVIATWDMHKASSCKRVSCDIPKKFRDIYIYILFIKSFFVSV